MKSKKMVVINFLILACGTMGFCLTSYGVMRTSFADIASPTGFGEGRFGEGPFGGGLTKTEQLLVNIGTTLTLLPNDQILTGFDKKRDAAYAIAGIIFLALGIFFQWFKDFFIKEFEGRADKPHP